MEHNFLCKLSALDTKRRFNKAVSSYFRFFTSTVSVLIFAVYKCPAAGQGLNGLNARQSEIFTEFPLKDSFKLCT